ncbi:MAG TPA: beta-propeller fold lactonase family protein, partial [Candidatus Angelobacter sp.]|nr:beta-propeller fold lactonase family protein [Candidatus Angelobacter sp.]
CHFVFAAMALVFGLGTAASAQTTFAYTANTLGGSISIYKLNTTTGALTQTGGSPFQNDAPAYLASSAGGKFLVVSGGECPGCGLQTFAINPTTGALTFSHSYEQLGAVTFLVGQIVNDAAGNTIYAQGTIQGSGTFAGAIDALHVNADGSLTQVGTPFQFGGGQDLSGEGPLAVDPKGRWVFAIITDSNNQETILSIPRNADGSLGNLDNPVNLTIQKCNTNIVAPNIAIDPQGKNLFVSCNANATATFNGIQVYGIDQTTGGLSRIDSFTTQHSFEALSSDRQGWRVFADTEESNLIEPFDFNRNVDQISLLNGGILYHTGSQPNGVVVDPSNSFVYVTNGSFCFPKQVANGTCTNSSSGNISGYSFNYTQGTLANLAGSPFPSGAGTRSMVFVTVP